MGVQVTITTAATSATNPYNTTDVSLAVKVPIPDCGPSERSPQIALITAWTDASITGSLSVRMALVSKKANQVYTYRDLTVTSTTQRTNVGTAGGGYVATVSCSDSLTNKADLLGSGADRYWVVFMPATMAGSTSVTLDFDVTPVL